MLTPQAVEQLFVTLRKLAARGLQHPLHQPQARRDPRALPPLHGAARRPRHRRHRIPAQETNASLSRMMIGAEPPRCAPRPRRRGGAARAQAALPRARTSSASTWTTSRSRCARARSSASPASPATASRSCWRAVRARTRAPRRQRSRSVRPDVGALGPRTAPARACTSCPRSAWVAARCRRWRSRRTRCSRAPKPCGAAAGSTSGRARAGAASSSASTSRPAVRRRRRARLSGGNLQKFIVGREIDAKPKLLIVSQPTWGVDVGAAAQIRGELLALRDAGCAVLVVSEELDELFEISDRLHVIAQGRCRRDRWRRPTRRADRRVDERAVGIAPAANGHAPRAADAEARARPAAVARWRSRRR